MLKVKDLQVAYGDVQVLWGCSLEVNEGELVALVGANGMGKTTMLRALSGLAKLKGGSMEFLGNRLDAIAAHKIAPLGLAHVPEGRQLFPHCSVVENLQLGALHPAAKANYKRNLEWVFELFPRLRERHAQYAGTLSGGEQQMLAVARGLMSSPRLIMFDEPSLGLAPMLVREIFRIVQEIRSRGVTVLLVEQNVRQTLEMCDRAYVMETGRITLQGTGSDLLGNEHVRRAYLGL
jgi:branched-chain amino acid transport system ATP-binding protein